MFWKFKVDRIHGRKVFDFKAFFATVFWVGFALFCLVVYIQAQ